MAFSTIATIVGAGLSVAQMMQKPKAPQLGELPKVPQPASQAAKAPTVAGVSADTTGTGQAGGSPGIAQTMLTGSSGVDPSTLNLGKNTLLGQ